MKGLTVEIDEEWRKVVENNRPNYEECTSARCNASKNRYQDVLAYDNTGVVVDGGKYVNASYVMLHSQKSAPSSPIVDFPSLPPLKKWIAAQAPLKDTVNDWWKMIWENNTRIIVMLTGIVERKVSKSIVYWPFSMKESQKYGDVTVTKIKQESITDEITIRTFTLSNSSEPMTRFVTHYHYTGWPDHGTPKNTKSFTGLVSAVCEHARMFDGSCTPVVHCSAGIGRTGVWLATVANHLTGDDVLDIISRIRKYRMGLVQTQDQYAFVKKIASSRLSEEL